MTLARVRHHRDGVVELDTSRLPEAAERDVLVRYRIPDTARTTLAFRADDTHTGRGLPWQRAQRHLTQALHRHQGRIRDLRVHPLPHTEGGHAP